MKVQILAPGVYQLRNPGNSGSEEVLTVNCNTDHAAWQETAPGPKPEPADSVLGLTRPFHIFRLGDLERAVEERLAGQSQTLTVDVRAGFRLRDMKDFLKSRAIVFGPDREAQNELFSIVQALKLKSPFPHTRVSTGHHVALYREDGEKKKVFLMNVREVSEEEPQEYDDGFAHTLPHRIVGDAVVAEWNGGKSLQLSYLPRASVMAYPEDHLVLVKEDELLPFLFADSRTRSDWADRINARRMEKEGWDDREFFSRRLPGEELLGNVFI